MTRLDVTLPSERPDIISSDPGMWLPAPARPAGHDTWVSTLRAGPAHRQVQINVGPPIRKGECVARSLHWEPGRHPSDVLPFEVLVPAFNGELLASPGQLNVTGTYRPPAGWLGAIADIVLRNAATHTVHAFIADIVMTTTSAGAGRDRV